MGRYVATLPADEQPTVVLSSPYERAAATAAHALSAMDGRLRVRHDERLRERELGIFDGLTGAGIREEFPHEADRRRYLGKFYYRPPSGRAGATSRCGSAASSATWRTGTTASGCGSSATRR